MNAVAVQRRIDRNPITLAHLPQQPFPARPINAGQAHDTGGYTAAQRQLLGLEHDVAGVIGGPRRGGFIDPFPVLLHINAAAGHKQQVLGLLFMLFEPAQGVLQTLNISRLITRLVVFGGRGAVHQVINLAGRPVSRACLIEQVACDTDDACRQAIDGAAQPIDLPAFIEQLSGQATSDITATDDQRCGIGHLKTPY